MSRKERSARRPAGRGREQGPIAEATEAGAVPDRLKTAMNEVASEIDAIASRGEVAVVVLEPSIGWKDALRMQGWNHESVFAMGERMRLSLSTTDVATEKWLAAPRPATARIFAVMDDASLLINRTEPEGYKVEPGSSDEEPDE